MQYWLIYNSKNNSNIYFGERNFWYLKVLHKFLKLNLENEKIHLFSHSMCELEIGFRPTYLMFLWLVEVDWPSCVLCFCQKIWKFLYCVHFQEQRNFLWNFRSLKRNNINNYTPTMDDFVSHGVELYIYDMTQGMASMMSPLLLGK